jgi:hypothetical protein
MKNRRNFLLTLTAGVVALGVIITPVIAAELLGVVTKIDVDAKKITVEKEDGKEVVVTVPDDTEYVSKKGTGKVDLEKLSKALSKIKDDGKKGFSVKVTHEKGVASKIEKGATK